MSAAREGVLWTAWNSGYDTVLPFLEDHSG
jgi:hypothetical protein